MNHIELTIADINTRIADLTLTRNALQSMLGTRAEAPTPTPQPAPATVRPVKWVKAQRATKPEKRGRPPGAGRISNVGQTLIAACRRLTAPFTVQALAAESGLSTGDCSNFLQRCKRKPGWIEMPDNRTYRLLKGFGGATPMENLHAQIRGEIESGKAAE